MRSLALISTIFTPLAALGQIALPPIEVPAPAQRAKSAPVRRAATKPAPAARIQRPIVRKIAASRPLPTRVRPGLAAIRPSVVPGPPAAPGAGQAAPLPGSGLPAGEPPVVQKFQLPQKSFSTTAKQIEETVNLKDPEDAVKYMPSLFVRKRNDGDNQAVLATRSWGLNSSARTLIYEDDLLISALIGNNNSGASPHWNLVAPDAIERMDFLNGPFAAAYPGNSIGGVLIISTKMPDHLVATAKQSVSAQPFSQYGTHDTYASGRTDLGIGDKVEQFSWFVSASLLAGYAQPLTYTTNAAIPAGTTGTFPALNKQGVAANVVGTGALTYTRQETVNLKLAYDFNSWLRAMYSLGFWANDQSSDPQTYLKSTATGAPTFGGLSSFAGNKYSWEERHISNALSLKSDTHGVFDFDLSVSSYNYLVDLMSNPYTVAAAGVGYSTNGKITRNDGTNWQNADAKGIWRPFGSDGAHEISFGAHGDRYYFNNPVYASTNWQSGPDTGNGGVYSVGRGETRTGALWAQDAWKITPSLKLTLGGRMEFWRAFDGFNLNTAPTSAGVIGATTKSVNDPALSSANFSPKASISWDVNRDWNLTASFGEAYRYPTVTELYQNLAVGGVATFANPFLQPEQGLVGEFNIERKFDDGRVRLTFFHDHTNNAIISQTNLVANPLTGAQTPTTTIGNVAAIRNQGVELSAEKRNVLIDGLDLFGSVTYVDSTILSDPTWAGTNPLTGQPDTVVGKHVPYVPDWRAKAGFTYRPTTEWAWTVAARYSGKQYSTLDNTDIIPRVYGAFDSYIVVDTRLHYEATKNFSFNLGIDNLTNQQYFLFHPFPGRTFVIEAKYTF